MEFIERAACATNPQQVLAAMRSCVDSCDVAYFSHRTIIDPARRIDLSTMPRSWLDHYNDAEYYRIDPGLQRVRNATGPIPMSFHNGHPTYQAEGRACAMFDEMKSFKARGSYFVPFRRKAGAPAASVNFLTDCEGSQFDFWLQAHAVKLHLCATVAHTRIFELMQPCAEDEPPVALAPREREVLQWLAQGLKTTRIAERMNISDRTVEFHLKNARSRLGASTREQALAKALTLGLIDV
ncbi:MAG: LuxR C-terminal-related transcriptional regulator [Pseudomonadota bacterium]